MENLVLKQCIIDRDYERIYEFLSNNYDCEDYHNWDIGRWTFTRYGVYNNIISNGLSQWEANIMLWEDFNSEIVAIAHIEEKGDYFIQIAKQYKNNEEDILKWILEDYKKNNPHKETIVLSACIHDELKKQLYLKYNAIKIDGLDHKRSVCTNEKIDIPTIDNGFKLIHIDEKSKECCTKISNLYMEVWPESRYMPNGDTVQGMLTSKYCKHDLTWAIVDNNGKYVAYTVGFVDSIGKYVHLYPVAVIETYLTTNILEVMLKSALNDIHNKGYEKVTIAAWYKDKENEIFNKVGFRIGEQEEFFEINLTSK